ncbi:MAG: T9SS type A sorting domain-containing protein [Phycisphaerae bacterium]|nr:T9SS type A sorting domain-containing protein [Saprospiraceae bacterium]
MNKFLVRLVIPLIFLQNIEAQTVERSLSAGFVTTADLIKPFDGDKWLLAGRGEPEPGAYFQDRLFVAVIGFDGQIYLRKNLIMPSEEVHLWHDVLALPDGGILASFESTLCDVGGYIISVQRLDAQGFLMWSKSGAFSPGGDRPPEDWFLAPDGNLLGAGYDKIWKVATNSGDILWKADLQGVSGGTVSPYEFLPILGTEDFYALGNPDFQVWQKTGNPSSPVYSLAKSQEIPGYRNRITPSPLGGFYCFQHYPDHQIEWINPNLDAHVLPIQIASSQIADITVGDAGFYLAESPDNFSNRLRRFDLQGQNPVELPAPSKWFTPQMMFAHNGRLAIAGTNKTGKEFLGNAVLQGTAAWLRMFPEDSPNPVSTTPNVAVTEIQQLHPIKSTPFQISPTGYVYDLSGGDFQVKISNLGDIPINQVCINTVFGYNLFFDICFNISAKQKQFYDLNLAPGASLWLDFGDIQASGQSSAPSEICFWTSSPNEQPDAIHENDRACHPASYTVSVMDPDFQQIALYPNPADDFVEIAFVENMEGEKWQIFDATGRLAKMGVCPSSQTMHLETGDLSNGFYLIRVKNSVVKFAVRH